MTFPVVMCRAASHDPVRIWIALEQLVGKDRLNIQQIADSGRLMAERRRYALHCPACGFRIVARADRLGPVLATLDAQGVSEISLASLAARVQ